MKKADSWARNRELVSAKVKKCRKTLARERLLKHGEDFPELPTQRASLQQRKQASKELLQVAQLNRKMRGTKRDARCSWHPLAILTVLRGTGWRHARAGRQWKYYRCDVLQLKGRLHQIWRWTQLSSSSSRNTGIYFLYRTVPFTFNCIFFLALALPPATPFDSFA